MATIADKTPDEIAATPVLAARFIMEHVTREREDRPPPGSAPFAAGRTGSAHRRYREATRGPVDRRPRGTPTIRAVIFDNLHIPFDFDRNASIGAVSGSRPEGTTTAPATRSTGAPGSGSGMVPLR